MFVRHITKMLPIGQQIYSVSEWIAELEPNFLDITSFRTILRAHSSCKLPRMRKYILIVAGILVFTSELEARAFQQAGDADQNAVIVLPENIPDARVIPPNAAIVDFQIQDGFEVQLVAAEPDIVDPVAITFDEDGAIWAVEMRGYMPTISGEGESDGWPNCCTARP